MRLAIRTFGFVGDIFFRPPFRPLARVRTLGDLDKAALRLSDFSDLVLQHEEDDNLVSVIYEAIPKGAITNAIAIIRQIAKPNHDKYYDELIEQYKTVRRFLPTLLNTVKF